MSEWFGFDPEPNGTYSYELEKFLASDHHAFIARFHNSPVGFALVQRVNGVFDLKEFFVLRRYRRNRTGQRLSSILWDQLPGKWQVRVYSGNKSALPFWKQVISEYTDEHYSEDDVEIDGKLWTHFHFQNGA